MAGQMSGLRIVDAFTPVPQPGGGMRRLFKIGFLPLLLVAGALLPLVPVAAQQVDSGSYQRVIEENLDLRRQQEKVNREIDDLRRQNAALLLDVQDLERKRDQLAALVTQLKTPDETRNEIARHEAEKIVLIREVERLRQALATVRSAPAPRAAEPPVPAPAPAPGSDLFRKLEQENATLREELVNLRGALQAEAESAKGLRGRIGTLEAEVAQREEDAMAVRARAERESRTTEAFRKAVEKLARHAYQQEKEIQELKDKLADAPARTMDEKARGNVVRDRSAIPLVRQAEKAIQEGNPQAAEKLYRQALDRDRKNPRLYYNLGVLYEDYLKQPRKAAQCYRQYLELDPEAGDADAVRAWILDLESQM